MSTVHSEHDVTALVLATAQGILEYATAFPPAGSTPVQLDNKIELNRGFARSDRPIGVSEDDVRFLRTHLGDQLRELALNVEEDLASKGHAICFSIVPSAGVYGFARTLHVSKQGKVACLMGAFMGDISSPVTFDPESPLVLEVLAGDLQRSVADRVRILSQLVCIYSDAIRFGGFRKCPLGEAVRLLRLAVSELREHYTREASDGASNAEGD